MSENMKLFLEKVSETPELAAKVDNVSDPNVLIAMAAEMGITLTADDFKKPIEEMDDSELDTVAGGGDVSCACAMGGGGTKDANDKTCACVLAGVGYDSHKRERCLCGFAGYGYDT